MCMDLRIEGKTALVTGGSHGIGLATALALAREGCGVHIASRTHERLMRAAVQFRYLPGGCSTHEFDALDPASVDHLVAEIKDAGGVDILVNNVGGGGRWGTTPLDTPMETWDQVYQKNARAAVAFTRALLPTMLERGWGRVVTIASIHGREAGSNPWFMGAKAAEIALMKGLAMNHDLSRGHVTFNTVAPGFIFIEGKDPEPSQELLEEIPAGVLGRPEDVASAVEPDRYVAKR